MTKSLKTIGEAIRDPGHPFLKIQHQPKKERQHRYERRKVREYLHLEDWLTEEAV